MSKNISKNRDNNKLNKLIISIKYLYNCKSE